MFFFFHLGVNSDITRRPRQWVLSHLCPTLQYLVTCAFCLTFWVSLIFWFSGLITFLVLFAAPPLVLLLNLTTQKLKPNEPPLL